jgi:archaetidylinositol phosphate synthase
MVLNKYRSKVDKILEPMAKLFSGLHPNTISAVSLIFALLAGIAFAFSDLSSLEDIFNPGHYIFIMLAIASICIFLNGFLDAVDGYVARITKRTSKRGDLFDHVLDRYADILILGGIMLSPYCDTIIGALAIVAVLLTSYMGTQAQALGCGRNYSGLLGRADRLAILIIAPLLQMWVNYYLTSGRLPLPGAFRLTILEYTMIWFIIAGNITAIHRAIHSWRELRDIESPQKTLDQYLPVIETKKEISNLNRRTFVTPTKSIKGHSVSSPKPKPGPMKPPLERAKLQLKRKAVPTQNRPAYQRPPPEVEPVVVWDDEKPVRNKRKTKPSKPPAAPKPVKLKTVTKPKRKPMEAKVKAKTKVKPMKLKSKPLPMPVKSERKTKPLKLKTKSKPTKLKIKTKTTVAKSTDKPKKTEVKTNVLPVKTKKKTKPLKLKTKTKARAIPNKIN